MNEVKLIDADKLKEKLSEDITRTFQTWDKKITVAEMETWVRDEIDNSPTILDLPELTEAYQDGFKDGQEADPLTCDNCEFKKFSEKMVDAIVDVMNKYGISSVEELERRVKGDNDDG